MDLVDSTDAEVQVRELHGLSGQAADNTQIYEGTNQIQRMVIARNLLR